MKHLKNKLLENILLILSFVHFHSYIYKRVFKQSSCKYMIGWGCLGTQAEKLTWSIIKKLTQVIRRIGFFRYIGQTSAGGSSGAMTVLAS